MALSSGPALHPSTVTVKDGRPGSADGARSPPAAREGDGVDVAPEEGAAAVPPGAVVEVGRTVGRGVCAIRVGAGVAAAVGAGVGIGVGAGVGAGVGVGVASGIGDGVAFGFTYSQLPPGLAGGAVVADVPAGATKTIAATPATISATNLDQYAPDIGSVRSTMPAGARLNGYPTVPFRRSPVVRRRGAEAGSFLG